MTLKEKISNDILIGMQLYIDNNAKEMLKNVLLYAFKNIEMSELESLPATCDNTNDYIIQLFMAKKAPKLSEHTVNYYLSTIRELIAFTNKSLLKVTESDIELYLLEKKKMGNTNTSLNNLKRNISAFYNFLRKSKLIFDNPCEGIESFKEIYKPIEHLEPNEQDTIKYGCKNTRDRVLVEFLRCTATRRGEIPAVRICDIDFSTGKILIYGNKGKKYRTVYLDDVALKYVKKYIEERNLTPESNDPLFVHIRDKSKSLNKEGIYSSIKTIAKRSNIAKNIYPHLFRKTCATQIVRRGGTDDMAGLYLGHAPRNVTSQHYISKDEMVIENIFRNCVAAV